ncbi:IL-6 subfamily cytokine M17 [Clupea harengus]|uniref:Ciliary neurotrophic factor n=1 Tax=Clupea harengus TaxID=7950 RepID=A0A6P3W016_CLUHA|nr:IL-6 subfamily cytokine M17 [Clupea harengus]
MRGHGRIAPALGPQSQDNNLCVSLLVLLLVCTCVSRTEGVSCSQTSCCNSLQKTLQLTRLLHRESTALLKTYKANQGEGVELICQAQSEGVPEATVSGQDWAERLMGIHVRLQEFVPHLRHVAEQQADLQPVGSPLLNTLAQVQLRCPHLSGRMHCLLQLLLPNSVLEPPGPTGQPPLPPLNSFQQKAYGCNVLTRFRAFLFNSQRELKALRGVACKRRTEPPSYTIGFHRH